MFGLSFMQTIGFTDQFSALCLYCWLLSVGIVTIHVICPECSTNYKYNGSQSHSPARNLFRLHTHTNQNCTKPVAKPSSDIKSGVFDYNTTVNLNFTDTVPEYAWISGGKTNQIRNCTMLGRDVDHKEIFYHR